MANESAEILKLMKDNGCDILDLKFTDLPGTWQHFSVPVGQVDDSLISKGVGFDGSSIRGFQSIDESDKPVLTDLDSEKLMDFDVDNQLENLEMQATEEEGIQELLVDQDVPAEEELVSEEPEEPLTNQDMQINVD